MKLAIPVLGGLLLVVPVRLVEACSAITIPELTSGPSIARVVGRVVGYGVATRIEMSFQSTASLILSLEEVVNGPIVSGYVEVVVYGQGVDCSSIAVDRETIEKRFPMGTFVAVRGRATAGDPYNGVFSQSMLAAEVEATPVPARVTRRP